MFCATSVFFFDLQNTQTFFLGLRMGGFATVGLPKDSQVSWSEGGLVAVAAATAGSGGRRGAPRVVRGGAATGPAGAATEAASAAAAAHLVDLRGGVAQRRA